MLLCTLSNSPTESPVLSLKSHCIFDSKALETFVKTNGKDPISNEPMELSDIIPISNHIGNIPKSNEITSPTYSSIPTMLSAFQNAWDSLSLELFQLRSELDKTRKELSLSLYKQDAAIKVAVGACKERDEARQALAKLIDSGVVSDDVKLASNGNSNAIGKDVTEDNNKGNLEEEKANEDVQMDDVEDWSQFVEKLRNEQESLLVKHKQENKERKGNSPIHNLSDINKINIKLNEKEKINHKKGGSIIRILPNETETHCIIIFDSGLFELVDIVNLKVISKMNVKLESSDDVNTSLLAFWNENIPYVLSHIPQKGRKSSKAKKIPYQLTDLSKKESKPINTELENISIAVSHPTLPIYILGSLNEFEVFYKDSSMYSQQLNSNLKDIKFHPDGLLIAFSYIGDLGVDIYDLIERSIKLNIKIENARDLKFASNGYYLFIGDGEMISLFDLRKNTIVQTSEISKNKVDGIFVDIFTSIVVYHDEYFIFDKKGKKWDIKREFEGLSEGEDIVGLLSDSESIKLLVKKNNSNDGCDLYKYTIK